MCSNAECKSCLECGCCPCYRVGCQACPAGGRQAGESVFDYHRRVDGDFEQDEPEPLPPLTLEQAMRRHRYYQRMQAIVDRQEAPHA